MFWQPALAQPFCQKEVFAERSHTNALCFPAPAPGDYRLTVLVDAVGIDYSSFKAFLRTLSRHPRGNKNERSVGHAWIILSGPLSWIECGHTAGIGADRPGMEDTVDAAIARGDPNPLAGLWREWDDGKCEFGSGDHKPTAAVEFELSKAGYEAIRSFLDDYDYRSFSIRTRDCTDFVVRAAELGGIRLGHKVAVNIPRQSKTRGRLITWWTDPVYSRIYYGSPDVLEESLRIAVKKKIGKNVLRRNRN